MTIFGMPMSMFLVFVATILAGSVGAIHFILVHVLMGKPFSDEGPHGEEPGEVTSTEGQGTKTAAQGVR